MQQNNQGLLDADSWTAMADKETWAAAAKSVGGMVGHGMGWIGEKFNQGLYEATGGNLGSYTSDQAGSSFDDWFIAEEEADIAAEEAGIERQKLTAGEALQTAALGAGQYLANTFLGLPAALGYDKAGELLQTYTDYNVANSMKYMKGMSLKLRQLVLNSWQSGTLSTLLSWQFQLVKVLPVLGLQLLN